MEAGEGAVNVVRVRGSEMLLVLTRGLPLRLTVSGLVLALEDKSSVNKFIPSFRLESSGSSGGREESGARKGLETVFAGGQEEATGVVKNGLNEDFFTGDLGLAVLVSNNRGIDWWEQLFDISAGDLMGGDLGGISGILEGWNGPEGGLGGRGGGGGLK